MQTGNAERDVYVIPPYESFDSRHYWLFEVAVNGLVNSNAKWQAIRDGIFCDLGLCQLPWVLQLLYIVENEFLIAVATKIVDDVLFCGEDKVINKLLQNIQKTFQLGAVPHGPGSIKYFRLTVSQNEDFSVTIHADKKIDALQPCPISRNR